jgi:hypothetical protein
MLLLDTPVHGTGQHGEVAEIVAHPAAVVHIFAVAFADVAGPLHLPAGGVTLGTTLFLLG